MARAMARGLLTVETHDPRDCATDKHRTVDDAPYGGGGGMVLKPEPVYQLWQERGLSTGRCIYLTADGQPLNQALAVELALEERLVLLCGHYKGVDERIRTGLIDQEISIGDYVLTGGEPAALVLIDRCGTAHTQRFGQFFFGLGRLVPRGRTRLPLVHATS